MAMLLPAPKSPSTIVLAPVVEDFSTKSPNLRSESVDSEKNVVGTYESLAYEK